MVVMKQFCLHYLSRLSSWLQVNRSARTRVLLALLLTAGIVAVEWMQWRPVIDADSAFLDAYARNSPAVPADERLAFVAVDDASLDLNPIDIQNKPDIPSESREVLQKMMAGWPWDRSVFARVIERILNAGALLVAVDIEFPAPASGDDELAALMARYPNRILLASAMTRNGSKQSGMSFEFRVPSDTVLPDRREGDPRVALVNVWPDEDGVVRSIRYRVNVAVFNNLSPALRGDFPDHVSLSARMAEALGGSVPDDYEPFRFRYSQHAAESEFRPRPIYELFYPQQWAGHFASGEFFRGKAVIIGSSAESQKDFHSTPLGGRMPGPEVHLQAANALLHNLFIKEPHLSGRITLILFAGFIGWLPRVALRRPVFQMLLVILIGFAWFSAGQLLFHYSGFALPVTLPVAALVLVGLDGIVGTFAYKFSYELKLSQQVRSAFERYVGEDVVSELLNQPTAYLKALGGVTREVTILFSDLRNFTRATASLDAHTLVTQLNEYFTEMVDCVFLHGGTLDKFMGDAVMAVWGNVRSTSVGEDARNAARCAVAMREAAASLNARWREEGRVQFDVGIALNHGPVVVGNIGSPSRMDFTVIGDAVNNAWRLQERSKLHPGDILISKSVADLIAPELKTEHLGEIDLPGGALAYHRISVSAPKVAAVPA